MAQRELDCVFGVWNCPPGFSDPWMRAAPTDVEALVLVPQLIMISQWLRVWPPEAVMSKPSARIVLNWKRCVKCSFTAQGLPNELDEHA